jgi:putative glutamine transport system substrate-binding protein
MRKTGLTVVVMLAMLALVACGPQAAAPTPTTPPVAQETPTTPAMETPTVAAEATPTETAPTGAMATPTTMAEGTPVGGGATLEDIKRRGKLIVGVKYDVPLFGFLNPETNQVEGFDVDMGRAVAQQIFGDPNAVEFKEAISRNRIPYLQQGVVDIVFSTMTANEERAQQIDFTDCYYIAGQSLLVPVNSDIQSINDLAGKRVGTVQGSTSEKNIREKAPQANVELFATYAEAVQAMESGRVDAVTTDDIILYGFQSRNPDKFKVVGGQFTIEPYAGGVRKGNTALLEQANAAIRAMKQDGRWAELYRKWIPAEQVPPPPPADWREVYKMQATPGATVTP